MGDGNRAVVGRENELGWRHSGQRQQGGSQKEALNQIYFGFNNGG
jgi:hypothetical protein